MKKFFVVTVLFLLILCTTFIHNITDNTTDSFNNILKKYKAEQSEFIYYNKKSFAPESLGFSHYAKQHLNEIQDHEKLLYYEFRQKEYRPDKEPIEVYAIFDIWLTLKENTIQYADIIAIASLYKVSNLSNDVKKEIIIFREEFEEFLINSGHTSSREQKVVLMTNLWMQKYYYNRTGLETPKEWRNLLTPWHDGYYSINDELEYCAYFSEFHNSFGIMKISGSNVKSAQRVFKRELGELGYLYGVWEENLDVWLWGETSGFRYFKYSGEDTWLEQDNDNASPPKTLRKISNFFEP